MKKTRSTKSALMMSALSLLLCCSMLIGTTFAWFTDSVTSANNIIKSGSLDVEMYWAEGTDAVPTTDAGWTDASQGAIFDYDKWEPGHTVVRHIKIANEGTLALKYKLAIVANGEVSDLADVIDVYYIDPAVQLSDRAELTDANKLGTLTEVLKNLANTANGELLAGENDTITLALKMQDLAGNEYQNKSIGTNFSVQLLATQLTSEKDSFDNQYDVESDYVVEVKTADALAVALKAGGKVKLASDISVTEALTVPAGVAVELDLNGKTINAAYAEGSTTNHVYAFTNNGNLLLKNGTVNARGIFNYGNMVLESGTINAIDGNGGYAVRNYAGATFTMNGGTIATTLEDDHQVNNGGYDATTVRVDDGATFVMNGGVINNICDYTFAIENSGTTIVNAGTVSSVHSTVTNYGTMEINGGTFTCNGLEGVTAHAVWASSGITTVNGGTFNGKDNYNGFNIDASAGAVVNVYGGNFLPVHSGSLYGEGTINVYGGTFFDDPSARVVTGYEVTNNVDGTWTVDEYKVSTGAELVDAIANGKAVELTQDVTLGKIDLTGAITNDVVIDANGHKVTTTDSYGIEVTPGKNVTISNANVEMTKAGDYITYAAGFKIANGDYAGATITLKNCTITMANTDWAYAVTMPASVKNLNLVIDNCTLEGAVAVQCWGDNNTITITNSKLICNYTTSALYTSYCVALQGDGTYNSENNTLVIDNCEFLYSGIDNFNSSIYSVKDLGTGNTVTVTDCTYGEKVRPY